MRECTGEWGGTGEARGGTGEGARIGVSFHYFINLFLFR